MSDNWLDDLHWAKRILDDAVDETHLIDYQRLCALRVIIDRAIQMREVELARMEIEEE